MFLFYTYLKEIKSRFFLVLFYFLFIYLIVSYLFFDLVFSFSFIFLNFFRNTFFNFTSVGADILSVPAVESNLFVLNNFYSYYFLVFYVSFFFIPFYLVYHFFLFGSSAMFSCERNKFVIDFIFKVILCCINLFNCFFCFFIICMNLFYSQYLLSIDFLSNFSFYVILLYLISIISIFFFNYIRLAHYFFLFVLVFISVLFYFHFIFFAIIIFNFILFELLLLFKFFFMSFFY